MKTPTQHTDGPWHINPRGFIVDSTGAIVTRMECSEDAGNAALVASAPDLLAALKTVTEHLRVTCNEYRRFANVHGVDAIHPLDDPVFDVSRAAIAKATHAP